MSGKFVNTQYTDTIDSIVNNFKDRMKHNFFAFNDKPTTIVTYFNIDTTFSVLDQGTIGTFDSKGDQSGLKFNKINNMHLYGVDNVSIMIDNGEFGAEASEISGDAIVLPNTIVPIPGDFFIINYLKENLLFRVISSHPDTLDNGANFYRVEYKVTEYNDGELDKYNILYTYEMVFDNVGNTGAILRSDKYNIINNIENILYEMKRFYMDLFYSDRVQTFILNHNGLYFYDSMLIEFFIRTKLLNTRNQKDYIYIAHQLPKYNTFNIDYIKTIFHVIEEKNKKKISNVRSTNGIEIINHLTSIFGNRLETYYKVVYGNPLTIVPNVLVENFTEELVANIEDNELFEDDILYNIIIKYLNNTELSEEDLSSIESINYENNIKIFYMLPCVMYILENYINTLMI